jgi:hypothetical protein
MIYDDRSLPGTLPPLRLPFCETSVKLRLRAIHRNPEASQRQLALLHFLEEEPR